MFDIVIIGAGVIGSLLARTLAKYELSIAVIEKCNDAGDVTSSANSAIIHSGYDPLPNTNKAKFNILANPMYEKLCDELDVSFKRIGSLTIALEDKQIPLLKDLELRAKENGVKVTLLNKEEVLKLEPNISQEVKGALFAPTAGIIDPFNLTVHAMENAIDNGVKLFLNEEVISIDKKEEYFILHTKNNDYEAKIIVNAAGLGSAKIASMIENIDWNIIPRKGEYYVLDHGTNLINHTIFPLPSEKGKGILVSPTTSGNIIVGPSSEIVSDINDTTTDSLTLTNIKKESSNMVNNIPFKKVIRLFSGVRATCSRHDFIIEYAKSNNHFINIAGIESPGLVSSPAIAEYVTSKLIKPLINLKEKKSYNPRVRRYIKDSNITLDKDYDEILCSCENVSLGEFKDIMSRSCPPHSIKGVKRRCRAGYGLCQGGFCQSKILLMLADYYHVSPLDIPYDNEESKILLEKVKDNI